MSGLRVSTLRGETPGTSPSLPDGAVVTDVITSTSFGGNLTGSATGNVVGNVIGDVTGNITGTAGTFSGNVSVGGVLTYEDVTNIDSIGIITARSGIKIGVDSELELTIDSQAAQIFNTGGVLLRLGVDYAGSGADKTIIYLDSKQVVPYENNQVNLGTPTIKFRNIYADAIFANEDGLKSAIVRTYPKLKGFENEFEFGFNLKVYPDDPVEVAMKSSGKKEGMSVGNWISNLLSPVDASDVGKN